MKSLFISPHFDDAVYSCGRLIAILERPTVLTVFGGMPENKRVVTAYDQKSGFDSAEDAVKVRREEDAIALTTLGAKQLYLDYPDKQYDIDVDKHQIRREIMKEIVKHDEVYLPLGMKHEDHELVGELVERIVNDNPNIPIYIYMELPYYVDDPFVAVEKYNKLPVETDYEFRGGDLGKKMLAVACYQSQFGIVNIHHLMADERYYRVKSNE